MALGGRLEVNRVSRSLNATVPARLGAHDPQVAANAVMACTEGLILHRIARGDDTDPRPTFDTHRSCGEGCAGLSSSGRTACCTRWCGANGFHDVDKRGVTANWSVRVRHWR